MAFVKETGQTQLLCLSAVKADRDVLALSKTIRDNTGEREQAFELYNVISTEPL